MLLVNAHKRKSLTVCDGIRACSWEFILWIYKESMASSHSWMLLCALTTSLLSPTHPTWIRKVTLTLSLSLLLQFFFKYLFKTFTSFIIIFTNGNHILYVKCSWEYSEFVMITILQIYRLQQHTKNMRTCQIHTQH
jgi:hypothetical protein